MRDIFGAAAVALAAGAVVFAAVTDHARSNAAAEAVSSVEGPMLDSTCDFKRVRNHLVSWNTNVLGVLPQAGVAKIIESDEPLVVTIDGKENTIFTMRVLYSEGSDGGGDIVTVKFRSSYCGAATQRHYNAG